MDDLNLNGNLQKLLERIDRIEQQLAQSQKFNAGFLQLISTLEPRLQGAMQHHTHNIKQTQNLIARQQKKTGHPISCVFLVHHIAVWDALVGVYEAMAEAPDFDPIVITLPHCFNHNKTFTGEDIVHKSMDESGIPHLRFAMQNSFEGLDILKALEPDIIFRQSPYDVDIPPAFATSEINFARLCYVSYGYQTIRKSEAENYLIVDQAFHRCCWRLFSLSEQHHAFVADNSILRGRNAVITGFPKFDRLIAAGKDHSFWPIDRGKRQFRVIWGAHHSVKPDWDGFGMFPRICNEMLEWARANQDVEIVFKPHPMLFESCAHGLMTQGEMDEFKAAWQSLPNTAFVEGGDYGPLFAASDAMISDGISFFSEYQLFNKPLIFLDSQQHGQFNIAGAVLLKGMYHATSVAEAIKYIEKFKTGGEDSLKEARKEVIREIMPYPGESVSRILSAICVGLEEEGRVVSL